MPIDRNEVNEKAKGGTELMIDRLSRLPAELLEPFQIIASRVRKLDENKIRIFWCHDLPGDPESEVLKNEGWRKFNKIVFVSYWQRDAYIGFYGIPYEKCTVIHNCIDPIEEDLPGLKKKPEGTIDIIYHTTPHRGLKILVPVFERLAELHDNINLNIYSSFEIYGWGERDEEYKDLFKRIDDHPRMFRFKTVGNDEIRRVLAASHIFAYPAIWAETSCLSLIEAMSARCLCVHPSFAALPETAANWTLMYDIRSDTKKHEEIFQANLEAAILDHKNVENTLNSQKSYVDTFYSTKYILNTWKYLLQSLSKEKPIPIEPKKVFSYRSGQ